MRSNAVGAPKKLCVNIITRVSGQQRARAAWRVRGGRGGREGEGVCVSILPLSVCVHLWGVCAHRSHCGHRSQETHQSTSDLGRVLGREFQSSKNEASALVCSVSSPPLLARTHAHTHTRTRTRMHTLARIFAFFYSILAFCPACSPRSCCFNTPLLAGAGRSERDAWDALASSGPVVDGWVAAAMRATLALTVRSLQQGAAASAASP